MINTLISYTSVCGRLVKKLGFLILCLCFGLSVRAASDNDRPITVDQLPKAAQAFIQQHFPNVQVSLAKVEVDFFDKEYKVIFVNGQKVEFDRRGIWREVNCKYSEVPSSIIPAFVVQCLKDNWPEAKIWKISFDKSDKEYEVKLSNRLELKFNDKGALIEVEED